MCDQVVTDLYEQAYDYTLVLDNYIFRFYHDTDWLLEEYLPIGDIRVILPSASLDIIDAIQADWIRYGRAVIMTEYAVRFERFIKEQCHRKWNLVTTDDGTRYEDPETQSRFETFAIVESLK